MKPLKISKEPETRKNAQMIWEFLTRSITSILRTTFIDNLHKVYIKGKSIPLKVQEWP